VLIEAMSLKMPIITTPIGGNVELIQDRETGLLVDYNDKVELEEAILELWQNKELAKGLSEKAYAFSRRFNRETMVKELLQEFDFFKKRKSDKRNILSISAYGRSLTNTGGAYSGAITRQIDYGTCVDKYVIICPGDDEDVIELSPNVRIYPVPAKSKLSFLVKSIAKAGWVIKKEKITGLICDNPFDAGIIGNILKVKYDMPLVVCSMGQMVGNKYYFKERKSNYLKNILGHINLRLADMIRVSTDAEVEQMKRCRLKTDKIFKSPCYIDFSDFEGGERDEKFRQSLLSGKFKKIVLFVGRFALAKDLATLIKGFKQAGKSYSDTLLVMVGDGSEMGMAKELIESEGLSEQVKLVGKVPNDQIAKYYRAADIFLATSLYEGICLVLQEAAICRLPIVATEFAGAVDLIKPGINGYLAPVGDHMAIGEQLKKLLALSEQDLKNMGSKNHDLVKAEYTRTGALEKFRKMFDGLL